MLGSLSRLTITVHGFSRLEEDEKLVLTPFEKNIEVWRQLWRVLERSDIVVQVTSALLKQV